MSDSKQAEGWWLATDYKWYPPEQHPDYKPLPPPPPRPPPKRRYRFAVSSLVLGIVTWIFPALNRDATNEPFWFWGLAPVACGVAAVLFGVMAHHDATRSRQQMPVMGMVGLSLGGFYAGMFILGSLLFTLRDILIALE